jgi:hypothetical protein
MEHAGHAPEWAAALEASWLGAAMRQSLFAYPVANLLHLLGLTLLAGPIMLLDLRLMGFGRALIKAEAASRVLTRFALAGLAFAAATGPLLFVADAKALSTSALLIAKLVLIAAALINAALLRLWWGTLLPDWDLFAPTLAKVQAAASIALWLTVAGLGRMIAYL